MSTAAAANSDKRRTLQQIEWLRCAACAIVVAAHCDTRWIEAGAVAVVLFLTVSVEFARRSPKTRAINGRIRKILELWLFWSAIYSIVVMARSVAKDGSPFSGFKPWMALTGPSHHLWYLPALALALATSGRCFGGPGGYRGRSLAIVVALLVPIAMEGTAALGHPVPLPQFAAALFSFCCAIAIGSVLPEAMPRHAGAIGWILVLLALCAVLLLPSVWIARALAVTGALLLCRATQDSSSRALLWASSLTAGIYLIHMAVALTVEFAFGLTLAWMPAILIASAALVAAIRRTPLRWIAP